MAIVSDFETTAIVRALSKMPTFFEFLAHHLIMKHARNHENTWHVATFVNLCMNIHVRHMITSGW